MVEALRAQALSVQLGARTVLQPLSFAAAFGELLAVVGPNGAGKSTLLRALCGVQPCAGSVTLEGVPLGQLDARERARRISFVPQHTQLSAALSVREVVRLGRYAHQSGFARKHAHDEAAVEQALSDSDSLGLAERNFHELSVGEQKRVMLARALSTEARTLLLDEPTAALDIEHALQLFALLLRLAVAGRAVVLVLHQLEHALRFADRTLLLAQGQLLAVGPSAEVLTPERVLAVHRVQLVPDAAPDFRLPGAH